MVFKYTYDERHKLAEVEESYAQRLAKIEDDLKKKEAGSVEFEALIAEHIKLYDEQYQKLGDLEAEFEQRHFDQLGNDPDVILANGKEQTELILKANYEDRIFYDIDEEGNPKSLDPKFESRTAISMLKHGLRLHFSALKGKPQHKELRDYIYNYVASSPYTYTDIKGEQKVSGEVLEKENITSVTKISEYGFMKDKVSKAFVKDLPTVQNIDGQMYMYWAIDNAGKNHTPVPVIFALSSVDANITTSQKIDSEDNAILTNIANCIYTLKQHDKQKPYNITPEEIWRRMNGIKDEHTTPSENQKKELCERIDKMRFTVMYMDITQEIQAGFITIDDERIKEGKVEDYYLPARKVIVKTSKGKEADAYQFYDMPFIYTYNMAKGHVVLVDYDLVNTSDETNGIAKKDELRVVVFRDYLLCEIQRMYLRDRNSNKILYSTLYKETAIDTPEKRVDRKKYKTSRDYDSAVRRAAGNDRGIIAALLKSWKKRNWISDFTPVKKGNSYIGVEIELNPDNFEQTQKSDKK